MIDTENKTHIGSCRANGSQRNKRDIKTDRTAHRFGVSIALDLHLGELGCRSTAGHGSNHSSSSCRDDVRMQLLQPAPWSRSSCTGPLGRAARQRRRKDQLVSSCTHTGGEAHLATHCCVNCRQESRMCLHGSRILDRNSDHIESSAVLVWSVLFCPVAAQLG